MNYYHCLYCIEIPLIIIKKDNIIIKCKRHGEYNISIKNYYNKCIEICNICNSNFPFYYYNNKYYCSYYMNTLGLYNSNIYNYVKSILSCRIHNNYYYDSYFNDCKEYKCKICKKNDSPNHVYIPNIIVLKSFIASIEKNIEKIKEILKEMKLILEIYKSLLYYKNNFIIKEIIKNFDILDIIKDIQNIKDKEQMLTMKFNEIIKELENFKYLELNGLNQNIDENFHLHDIKEIKNKLPKDNICGKLEMKESMIINDDKTKKNANKISRDTDNNTNKMNNIYIYNENENIYVKKINNDNNKNNNSQMGIIIKLFSGVDNKNDNYLNNNKKEISCINNNYIAEKEISKDLGKIFQSPKNKLYQNYAIKLEYIDNFSLYIINKVINISHIIEDEIDEEQRNNYLFSVGNIARVAHNYSNELAEILIKKYLDEYNEFSSIIYENAKIELSSWVNQSLIIDESNKDMKYLKNFYRYYTDKEKSRITNYIIPDEKVISILDKNYYDFGILFRDLSQLYTETQLYSEKDISLKYVEKCEFDHSKMIDAIELSGRRYVKFTIMPGLFVSKYNINNGKIFVFCTKKLENNDNNPFSDNIPKIKELSLPKTIKRDEIKNKIFCSIQYNFASNYCQIFIITKPNITKTDHPKYSLIVSEETKKNIKLNSEKPEFSVNKKDILYKKIYVIVEISGQKIKSNEVIVREKK